MAKFSLPELPFALDALAPHISEKTLQFHWGKHHQTYVDNLNKLIEGTEFSSVSLEEIICKANGGIFNNAAQVWNHTFYWQGLTPNAKEKPCGKLLAEIEKEFGSFDAFKEQFTQKALTLFGSGWTWLVKDNMGKLEILQTQNAVNPLTEGKTPLLVCDVWEHAYYLDYQNARAAYLNNFWQIINWDKIEQRLG
jgi:Superoxide dismutase